MYFDMPNAFACVCRIAALRLLFAVVVFAVMALAVGALSLTARAAQPPAAEPVGARPVQGEDDVLARGAYLATAANCETCHTAHDGEAYAGNLPFRTPFGVIYSTNITPDAETGIGDWTLAQFKRSLRKGVGADGEHLYPVFPYTSFTKMTDEDIEAVYRYLMSLPPVSQPTNTNDMPFPFNQRWLMAGWKLLFLKEGPFERNPDKPEAWNRGAYLVEGLAHCSACHSPRNGMGAIKAGQEMSGGVYIDRVPSGDYRDWAAPNLTSASNGLRPWSEEEIVAYLKTGKNSYTASFGPMNEVIMNSTRHLSDGDLQAMAVYLKSLPPVENSFAPPAPTQKIGRGRTLYDLHCGTCHQPTGLGAPETGARLANSLIVQASDPSALINVILYGPQLPDPWPPIGAWKQMPSFNDKLKDDEIAALASYLRQEWGNRGGEVAEEDVAKQRPPYDTTFIGYAH